MFADRLGLHLVAEPAVDEDLDVGERPAVGLQDDELRIAQSFRGAGGRGRAEHRHGGDLVAQQPAGDVDLVGDGVADQHGAGEEVRAGHVAVAVVQHQRPAQLPGSEQRLEADVLGVVAAHEADLHPAVAEGLLGLHDAQRGGRVGGERLLAQDGQVVRERGEQRLLVGGPRGGDEHGVDVRRLQGLGRVGVGGAAVDAGRDGLGPFAVEVDDRGDPRPADHPVDPPHVVGAHAAGADDGDSEGSRRFMCVASRSG